MKDALFANYDICMSVAMSHTPLIKSLIITLIICTIDKLFTGEQSTLCAVYTVQHVMSHIILHMMSNQDE